MQEYDVIIIGGGPAGMTAGIYAARAGAKVLMLEKECVGGQMAATAKIDNYPGFKSVNGFDLSQTMLDQVTNLGVEVKYVSVDVLNLKGKIKKVQAGGETYTAPSVILAMGASARGIGAKGEKEFTGKGVSYCAVCDGAFFRGKTVAVVGGGNTAVGDAIYLAPIVKKLYIIHRRDVFTAQEVEKAQLDKLIKAKNSNIELKLNNIIESVSGSGVLSSVTLRNVKDNTTENLALDGVFVAVGRNPNTEMIEDVIELNGGYIVTNEKMETNVAGVYAAGDVVVKQLRQIATAVSDGAIAGTNAAVFAKKSKQ
ncbi:MAG: FAD-dependent oxidoreductase [Clostridia bacterium]|nr:FAD-dependent oxidoreductase [Clostridia bacterium]